MIVNATHKVKVKCRHLEVDTQLILRVEEAGDRLFEVADVDILGLHVPRKKYAHLFNREDKCACWLDAYFVEEV